MQQTEVSRPTQNPIWNATLTFAHVKADSLMDRYIDIQLWDLVPHTESIFLGECSIELQQAFLDDQAIWCRLEDPKGLRGISMSKSPSVSPRGSIAAGAGAPCGDVTRLLRRDYNMQRSISDEVDSIGDGASLLHPDTAWIAGSRRGSSQSETMEVEVYQLGKDFSRSLPGSRRSSFQDAEKNRLEEDAMATPPTSYLVGRRRSSVARRDPDEILKSLKAVRGELGRTMSLGTEQHKRIGSRREYPSSNCAQIRLCFLSVEQMCSASCEEPRAPSISLLPSLSLSLNLSHSSVVIVLPLSLFTSQSLSVALPLSHCLTLSLSLTVSLSHT